MNCPNCGKKMNLLSGTYSYEDKFLGEISIPIPDDLSFSCSCGCNLLSLALLHGIEEAEKEKIGKFLMRELADPSDFERLFFSNKELVDFLGISRQAIAKNVKLKYLIYHVTLKGQTFFYRPSAELYKSSGDGRIVLLKKDIFVSASPQYDEKNMGSVGFDLEKTFYTTLKHNAKAEELKEN